MAVSQLEAYKICVPDIKIQLLKRKLALAEFPHPAADAVDGSWDLGPPPREIQRLVEVWQESYNWRDAEAGLNQFPQFIQPITVDSLKQTYRIHLVHMKSAREGAIPLLFLHGWPGSFVEVTKIIRALVDGNESTSGPVFDVVAPSLVDFGFSSASTTGFRLEHHAEVCHKLMLELGYDRYVVQAGDVGSIVARFMAKAYGASGLLAYHLNTPSPTQPDKDRHPDLYAKSQSTPPSQKELQGLARVQHWSKEGRGYYQVLSTRPGTAGYALRDSPVALLAWLYEKMVEWSDGYQWTDDEILTWVIIHYFSTAGPEAPGNVYYAMDHDDVPAFVAQADYVDVPLGTSRFENDAVVFPKLWNQTLGPVVWEDEHPRGGHFAAWEQPDAIIQALRGMFARNGPLKDPVNRFY